MMNTLTLKRLERMAKDHEFKYKLAPSNEQELVKAETIKFAIRAIKKNRNGRLEFLRGVVTTCLVILCLLILYLI